MKLDAKSFLIGIVTGGAGMFILCLALLLGVASYMNLHATGSSSPAPIFCPMVGDTNVTQCLKPVRQKFNIPAMSMAVVTSEGLKYTGAVGVLKRGTETPVGPSLLWHLGSDGKIMTSTLIALLVERGQLHWETTVAEVFPEFAQQMHPEFRQVTLLHLLSHHAGLPPNLPLQDYSGDNVQELRLRAVNNELAKKPESKPGTKFNYSNLGYIIAAAVVEKTTGQSWETCITEEVFKPLQMTTAGFGGTGTPGKIDQPWPHTTDGAPTPMNGSSMDNLPVMGPAGRIHCTIQDWARFVQDQLRGAQGKPGLLKAESYKKLQTQPFNGDYALGWLVAQREWGGGKVLNHGGDNTMNRANVWVAPKKDFAILVCANQSGDAAGQATDEAVSAMILSLQKH